MQQPYEAEITGEVAIDDPNQKQPWWAPVRDLFNEKPPTHRVLTVTGPKETAEPALGTQVTLPFASFTFATFFGDFVLVEQKPDGTLEIETFQHGYQRTDLPRTAADALKALILFHGETMRAATAPPRKEIAGRSKYAAFLLNMVMGDVAVWPRCPRGALSVEEQSQAIELACAIFKSIGLDEIEKQAPSPSSHHSGCRELVQRTSRVSSPHEKVHASALGMALMHCFMPHRKPSRREIDSIGHLLGMAAEADRNYGPGTGERALDKVFAMQQ